MTLLVDIELRKCTIKSITESVNFISTIDSLLPLLYEPCRSYQIRSAICRLYLDLQIDSLHPDVFDKTCYVHWLQKRALCIRGPEVPENIGTWGLAPCQFLTNSLTLMPCRFTGPNMFWAGLNFLCQTKSYLHIVAVSNSLCQTKR